MTLRHRPVVPADHLWVRVCSPRWMDPFDPDYGDMRQRSHASADGTGSRRQPAATGLGSLGSPSTRSPTMLRWISAVPPQIVSEREKKNAAWRALTG